MTLYEIQETMIDNLNIFLESEGSEFDQEVYEEIMNILKIELSNKSSNILKYLNNLQADLEQIKLEKQRLDKIKKSKEAKYNRLSDYIISVMTNLDKAKIETNIGNYALRKSTKVEILDEKLIPEEYFNISIDKTVNKVTLKEVLKSQEVPGVRLATGYNLNIQ
jgi:hypothetical protein